MGNQAPGVTLQWGRDVIGRLQEVHGTEAVRWLEQPLSATAEDREMRHAEATLNFNGESHRALFAEARWSDVFAGLAKPSLRRTLVFLAVSLPLLACVVGPDRRDLDVLGGRPRRVSFLRFASPENRAVGRLMWRLTTAAVLAIAMLYAVALSSMMLVIPLLAVLAWWARSRWNLVWHVRMAATDEEGTRQLLAHLHQRLHWMERQCDEVVVVAHSQGGYLMHRVLSPTAAERHPKVRRLIGVGSGLKPITLLRTLHSGGIASAVWLAVGTVPLYVWALGPLLSGLLGWILRPTVRCVYALMQTTVLPIALMERPEAVQLWVTLALQELMHAFLSMPSLALDWIHLLGLAVALSTFRVAGLLIQAAVRTNPPPPMTLGVEWREYSSPHDIVGRMLVPALPDGVDQPCISATGQPIADHGLYFHPTGVLPRRLAADLLGDLLARPQQVSVMAGTADKWEHAARDFAHSRRMQASRRRTLHGLILGGATALLLSFPLYLGVSLPLAFLRFWPLLAGLLLLLTVLFSLVAHRSAKLSARVFTARLTETLSPAAAPWRIRIVPHHDRVVPTTAAGTGGIVSVFGAVHFGMTALRYGNEAVWAGFGVLLPFGLGLILIACASAAGYPVRRRWPVLLSLLLLLAAYPPSPHSLPWQLRPEVTLMACLTVCLVTALAGVAHAARRASDLAAPSVTGASAPPAPG
ncbi:hypothetical protein ACFRJ1_07230 [Streptomyces sp. NPDC056773]|uniref:hypothetical protein n=1 Tax=unclassified Streptomyces TaxID=2593676 RepID=UPI00368D4E27